MVLSSVVVSCSDVLSGSVVVSSSVVVSCSVVVVVSRSVVVSGQGAILTGISSDSPPVAAFGSEQFRSKSGMRQNGSTPVLKIKMLQI